MVGNDEWRENNRELKDLDTCEKRSGVEHKVIECNERQHKHKTVTVTVDIATKQGTTSSVSFPESGLSAETSSDVAVHPVPT